MPHLPDTRTHADHDLELVAAYAAGDAGGTDLETAAALVAGCPQCAAVHHDLRAIAAALPALPPPVRHRDYRLTPEQAAALRPAGWRGVVAALAGPRFRFAAPLGTGLATLGLAGLLVGSLGGIPLGASGAAMSADVNREVQGTSGPAYGMEAPAAAATATPGAAAVPSPLNSARPSPGASSNQDLAGASPEIAGPPAESPGVNAAVGGGSTPEGQTGAKANRTPAVEPVTADVRAGDTTPAIVAGLALVVGVVLVAIRLAARRLTSRGLG